MDPQNFQFRDLNPELAIGTSSDRYAGWIGQIYAEGRYKTVSRSKKVGGQSFKERVLPIESVAEYFEHFPILELDFTFYRPLLDQNLEPTSSFHTLVSYAEHLKPGDGIILKAPQMVMARSIRAGKSFGENENYLNAKLFIDRFYEPAIKIMDAHIIGFIFEQEYLASRARPEIPEFTAGLEEFFKDIPDDNRYHLEIRTETLLKKPYFDCLAKFGVGQVLSHWTWLPALNRQFELGGNEFLNSGKSCIIRLLTPQRMKYDETYARAFPFDKMVDGMLPPGMIEQAVEISATALEKNVRPMIIINNRVGGNAPIMAGMTAKKFLDIMSGKA